MNKIKPQLSINQSCDEQTTKLRIIDGRNKSITCIENFSNEIFLEIFDYLDGCDIYDAFSRLNTRFKHLIGSCLLLKINLSSESRPILRNRCWRIIFPNRHRIVSFSLSNTAATDVFFTFGTIDSSFKCLESLVLKGIDPDKVMPLLMNLAFLPRLFSLKIDLDGDLISPMEFYGLIFRLPVLKYNKISSKMRGTLISMPLALNEEFSSIEHLILDHPCALNELIIIFSYTPRLRYFSCKHLFTSHQNTNKIVPMILFNLTHIILIECQITFDELQIFISTISPKIQLLRISTSRDNSYLDADRWENIISKYMPHLRKFDFQFNEFVSTIFELKPYHTLINRFTSPFWIERQWFLDLHIETCYSKSASITYSIHPIKYRERERWYELQKHLGHEFSPATRLIVVNDTLHIRYRDDDWAKQNRLFIDQMKSSFTMVHIAHLEATFGEIDINTFIEFLYLFPDLDSFKVSCHLLRPLNCLSTKESQIFHSLKITKLSLWWINKMEDASFLIDLCPYLEYLEIDCTEGIDPELFVKSIFHINTICLYVQKANDELITKFQQLIEAEKFLDDYTIKCISDNRIYFQCK